MTELGYAGNQRYLMVTTAALCVLGRRRGVGWVFAWLRSSPTAVAGSARLAVSR